MLLQLHPCQTFQTLACCCVAVYCQNSASSCLLLYKHVHGQTLDCSASNRHTTAPSMCTRSLGSRCCYSPCFLAALSLAVGDCCAFICCGAVLYYAVLWSSHPPPYSPVALLHSKLLFNVKLGLHALLHHPEWHMSSFNSAMCGGLGTGECRDHHHI